MFGTAFCNVAPPTFVAVAAICETGFTNRGYLAERNIKFYF